MVAKSPTLRGSQAPTELVAAGGGALRAALEAAPAGSVLRLAAGDHVGPFVLQRPVKLLAASSGAVSLVGDGRGTLLRVMGRGVEVSLVGLVFHGGGDTNAGGAIEAPNGARLVMTDCTVRDSHASGHGGGAIALRRGELVALNCRFSACTGRSGGAILVAGQSHAHLHGCTFSACTATHLGAAIAVRDEASAEVSACDFRGIAPGQGAGEVGAVIDIATNRRAARTTIKGCRFAVPNNAVRGRRPDGSDVEIG